MAREIPRWKEKDFAFRKPPVWMKAGDTIEIEVEEVEKVGNLRNPIEDEK